MDGALQAFDEELRAIASECEGKDGLVLRQTDDQEACSRSIRSQIGSIQQILCFEKLLE